MQAKSWILIADFEMRILGRLEKPMFEVTVTQVETRTVPCQEWKQLSDGGNPIDKGPTYGYAESTRQMNEEVQMFHAKVSELDLASVVKAVFPNAA